MGLYSWSETSSPEYSPVSEYSVSPDSSSEFCSSEFCSSEFCSSEHIFAEIWVSQSSSLSPMNIGMSLSNGPLSDPASRVSM
jgi:hypothetical protein